MAEAVKSVRVVAFQEDGVWVAHCVEYDICVQANDLAQARRRMTVALTQEAAITTTKHGTAFAGLDRAPDYFESMYQEAEESLQTSDFDFRIAA
ncbi:MAG: hypothetical protein ABL882_09140 [Sphingopyxis sp.]